jgi:hypothetical protein
MTQPPVPPTTEPSPPAAPTPTSIETKVNPAAPAVSIRSASVSESGRPSALFPPASRSAANRALNAFTETKPEPSLISSATAKQQVVAAAPQPVFASVRAVGVQPATKNEQVSLILDKAAAELVKTSPAPAADLPATIAGVRPVEATAIPSGVQFPNSQEQEVPMSAGRSQLGPTDFLQPAPVRR